MKVGDYVRVYDKSGNAIGEGEIMTITGEVFTTYESCSDGEYRTEHVKVIPIAPGTPRDFDGVAILPGDKVVPNDNPGWDTGVVEISRPGEVIIRHPDGTSTTITGRGRFPVIGDGAAPLPM